MLRAGNFIKQVYRFGTSNRVALTKPMDGTNPDLLRFGSAPKPDCFDLDGNQDRVSSSEGSPSSRPTRLPVETSCDRIARAVSAASETAPWPCSNEDSQWNKDRANNSADYVVLLRREFR
jgi:hypothetical protein